MSSEDRPTLNYADDRAAETRRRVVKLITIVIAIKLVLVVANVYMAFNPEVPSLFRTLGLGLQIALTGVFLVLLFRLSGPPRR